MDNNSNCKTVSDLKTICSESDNRKDFYITSECPSECKTKSCVLGIDEAGRGPVLGPMVYGTCYCVKTSEGDLNESGCADSKTLTEEAREQIFEKLCAKNESIGWEVCVISPVVLSAQMMRRQKVSLNEISHDAAICLIQRALDRGVQVTDVFVDTVGPPEKYQAKLQEKFPQLKVTVAKKADSLYPVVGGASICAKVTRDVSLRVWKFTEPVKSSKDTIEWGSGYPGDPVTKKFLEDNLDEIFGFPQLVRFSWSTAEKLLDEKAYTAEYEEDEPVTPAAPSVKSFFKVTSNKNVVRKHRFFTDRNLTNEIQKSK